MLTLRDYQDECLIEIREVYRSGVRYLVFVLPTGAGKTPIFCAIAMGAAAKGNQILILVHRMELLRQCVDKLAEFGVQCGIIKAGYPMALVWNVQVGSVQTVAKRLDILREPALIVCDEGHHATSPTYRRIFDHWPNARRLLVTASPERLDGTGLITVAEHMIVGPSQRELIDKGYLAQPIVYAPPAPDMSQLHTIAGEYDMHEAEALMDKPTITGSAVGHYKKLSNYMPALPFCTSIKHAAHVAEQFSAAGYQAAMIEGKHSDQERRRMITDLAEGRLHILTSAALISEGVDIPVVQTIINLAPTMSLSNFLQRAGRAGRKYPGKTHYNFHDHVNSVMRFGLPDAMRNWTLEGKKRTRKSEASEKPISLTVCASCWATFEPATVCPQCGAACVPAARKGPQEVAGELVQVSAEAIAETQRVAALHKRREEGQAQTLEDFQRIGRERGYSPQWAHVRWNIRSKKIGDRVRPYDIHNDLIKQGRGFDGFDIAGTVKELATNGELKRVSKERGERLAFEVLERQPDE